MDAFKIFVEHPRSVGETYTEHFRVATGFGLTMVAAGLACVVHGLLPFLFTRTGSDAIRRLHERMVSHRVRNPAAVQGTASSPASGGE